MQAPHDIRSARLVPVIEAGTEWYEVHVAGASIGNVWFSRRQGKKGWAAEHKASGRRSYKHADPDQAMQWMVEQW